MSDLVYGSYDQENLDLEYDMRRRCPHFAETFATLEPDNARVVEKFKCNLDVPFGDTELQKLDVWPGTGSAPMLMFIHGGYWKAFDKAMFRFVSERFLEVGACVVLNNYDLCPNVTMDTIVDQNRKALKWIYDHSKELGCDRDRFFVTGHSAGGHLSAILGSTDWRDFGLSKNPINRAFPVSGLYDLEPLRLSYLNADLLMSEEDCHRVSPIHMVPGEAPPMIIAVGGGETDEFKRQSRIYTDACKTKDLDVEYMELGEFDHVHVAGQYANPDSPLTSSILAAFDA